MITRNACCAALFVWAVGCGGGATSDGGSDVPSANDGSVDAQDLDSGAGSSDAAGADAIADAGATDDASSTTDDGGFAQGPHEPLPQFENQGGPTIQHPQLVVVTFADDPHRADDEAFGQWIVGSNWLATAGMDYGITAGTYVGSVELPQNAPDTFTELQAQDLLAQGITDGSIPKGADGTTNGVVYLVYFPAHTTVTSPGPAQSCVNGGGLHNLANRGGGLSFEYGLVFSCGMGMLPSETAAIEIAASRQFIDALTDPDFYHDPAWALPRLEVGGSAWILLGGEVGFECSLPWTWTMEGSFYAGRVWSNSAAAMGLDPCVPNDASVPYFNTAATPNTAVTVAAGMSTTFQLQGWSTAPVVDWTIAARPSIPQFIPTLRLSQTTMNNGGSATLTVGVPATARTGQSAVIIVQSAHSNADIRVWPLFVQVQ